MQTEIYRLVLPVSICLACLGFSTIRFRCNRLNNYINLYCWVITTTFVLCGMTLFTIRLRSIEFTFINAVSFVSDVVTLAAMTYYRVKFLTKKDAFISPLENISYVEGYLPVVRVKVPYRREQIACALYSCATISGYLFLNWKYVKSSLSVLQSTKTLDLKFLFGNMLNVTLYSAVMFHTVQFNIIMNIIRRRFQLLKVTVERHVKLNKIKLAWVDTSERNDPFTSDVTGLLAANIVPNRNVYFLSKLIELYAVNYTAYCQCKQFYNCYMSSSFPLNVFLYTVFLYFTIIYKNSSAFFGGFVFLVVVDIIRISTCMRVRNTIQSSNAFMHSMLFNEKLIKWRRTIKTFCLQQSDVTFDCGYFFIDTSLVSLMFSFVPLFVFASVT